MSTAAPPPIPPDGPAPAEQVVVETHEEVVAVVPECAECHSALEPDQPYCLVCGAPTPRAPRLRPRGRSAGLWIALALTALAVAAGLLAWILYNRDDDRRRGTTASTVVAPPVATVLTSTGAPPTIGGLPPDPGATYTTAQPVPVPAPGTTAFQTVTGLTTPPATVPTSPGTLPPDPTFTDPATTQTTTAPAPEPAPAEPVQTDVASDWPSGTSAWTVIIASTTDAQSAINTRDGAQSRGLSPGILKSGEHTGLRSGYFVVYVGQYQSRQAVIRRTAELKQWYPRAYPRYVNA